MEKIYIIKCVSYEYDGSEILNESLFLDKHDAEQFFEQSKEELNEIRIGDILPVAQKISRKTADVLTCIDFDLKKQEGVELSDDDLNYLRNLSKEDLNELSDLCKSIDAYSHDNNGLIYKLFTKYKSLFLEKDLNSHEIELVIKCLPDKIIYDGIDSISYIFSEKNIMDSDKYDIHRK